MLLRSALYFAGISGGAALAIAAVDIPTRYSGAFPSTANISNISGTFTGQALSLRGTGRRGGMVAGQYTCARLSETQTRCSGTLRAVNGNYRDRHIVTITWSGGRPVAMSGAH